MGAGEIVQWVRIEVVYQQSKLKQQGLGSQFKELQYVLCMLKLFPALQTSLWNIPRSPVNGGLCLRRRGKGLYLKKFFLQLEWQKKTQIGVSSLEEKKILVPHNTVEGVVEKRLRGARQIALLQGQNICLAWASI